MISYPVLFPKSNNSGRMARCIYCISNVTFCGTDDWGNNSSIISGCNDTSGASFSSLSSWDDGQVTMRPLDVMT